jgi:hypothetical protein
MYGSRVEWFSVVGAGEANPGGGIVHGKECRWPASNIFESVQVRSLTFHYELTIMNKNKRTESDFGTRLSMFQTEYVDHHE